MKRIAAERILLGMTQKKLAEALGTTNQTVYRWENGVSIPKVSELCKLAEMFGCTTDWLLGRSESRK